MNAGSPEGSVIACHGHGDEADGYGAGFGWGGEGSLAVVYGCNGKEWEDEQYGSGQGIGMVPFFAIDGCQYEERTVEGWFGLVGDLLLMLDCRVRFTGVGLRMPWQRFREKRPLHTSMIVRLVIQRA